MMTITRYRLHDDGVHVYMAITSEGRYVLHDDHLSAIAEAHAAGFAEGIMRAAEAIANLETPMTEDCMLGHEDAYRAVKAIGESDGQP